MKYALKNRMAAFLALTIAAAVLLAGCSAQTPAEDDGAVPAMDNTAGTVAEETVPDRAFLARWADSVAQQRAAAYQTACEGASAVEGELLFGVFRCTEMQTKSSLSFLTAADCFLMNPSSARGPAGKRPAKSCISL